MKPKKYDIIVIGAGGGTKLVTPPSKLGHKVAVIEKDALGGTCLNRGCIPSKMLIHPADVAHEIDGAKKFDIHVNTSYRVDFEKLVRRVTRTVRTDAKGIEKAYAKNKRITYYHGHATFVSNSVVAVNGKHLTAPKIIIATGARPRIPNIVGLEGTPYMTSTEALRNTTQPKSMIVIGGGYIGTELGHFYGGLGTTIQIVNRGRMIGREDKDVIDEFEKVFSKRHTVHLDFDTTNVSYKNKQFTVAIKHLKTGKKKVLRADALLVATGVIPNSDALGLENTDVRTDKRGFIRVDKYLATHAKGIWAMGDVTGKYLFRHAVNFEGEYLFHELIEKKGRNKKPIQYPPMPHAIFSNPQVGGVGATEQELIAKGTPYVVGMNRYEHSAMGMALRSDYGFVKLLFHKKTKKLLGAHIIGPEASNMIHMLVVFMTMNAKLDDLLNIIYIHPALPEIVRNAARKAKEQFVS